ncbi:hypothetical protein L6164_007479 [Bauhinia variegata]|nr:hypothetical protein L6164_007479 [Bauhinia variegata]
MTEAQDVLSAYLHSTRGYSFLDAEYISKNSPHFLQTLVSSIHVKEGVARSLRKFLRYNPINEFEPFLESLGVSPSELPLLMPRGMHFLSDDYAMLETFHALSNYGIPRNIMGKIYKEAREVFGYGSVLLSKKFRAYENLGLSKSTVIKLVSSCPELLLGDLNSEFAMVLDWLKKIGIENDWMGKYLSYERTYDWERMLDTIEFFDKVGYSGKHMLNLFKTSPALLFEGCGKMVYVLFGRLFKSGLKTNVIHSSFIQNPCLMSNKCSKNLLKVVDFLYDIGMGSEAIAHIMSNHMQLLSAHSLKGPKTVCRVLKVKKTDLCQIISDDPLKLISLASKSKQKCAKQLSQDLTNHMEKTKFLLKLGYVENSEEMEKALKKYRGRGDQLQERFDCLVAAGLDYNIVTEMIKRAPMILNQSKDIIEKKIDCLRNILGYPLESLVAFPSYLCYDLERIIQRFSMYAWLKERGAAKPMLTLSTILVSSDERFVKYFVNVHPEGPNVWEGLKNLTPST